MDRLSAEEIESWGKIAEALEKAGKTESYFYRRAISIMKTGRDPMKW